jgi:hypothetical protein
MTDPNRLSNVASQELLESPSLVAILGSPQAVSEFFSRVWQRSCGVFPWTDKRSNDSDAHARLVSEGWSVLVDLMEAGRLQDEEVSSAMEQHGSTNPEREFRPLLFQNQAPIDGANYQKSLFASYLDNCSIVMNHADSLSAGIAALCNDLQMSFPHAYANTYLTPPDCQTVPAHADDRDVLVFQILGSKEWTVYHTIPVPYPYPHEQVGKDGRAVPDVVLDGPVLIKRILKPGDIMYMPRGYVHEAKSLENELSFHVTVALATHDWSFAGMLSNASREIWHTTVEYRKAINREFGMRDFDQISDTAKQELASQLDDAFVVLREQITVAAVHESLRNKYTRHNTLAQSRRELLCNKPKDEPPLSSVVGRFASERVGFTTRVRAATPDETASLPPTLQPRGLHVRDINYERIILTLNRLKQDSSLVVQVDALKTLVDSSLCKDGAAGLCMLTWLCFARQCVELGALAIVQE